MELSPSMLELPGSSHQACYSSQRAVAEFDVPIDLITDRGMKRVTKSKKGGGRGMAGTGDEERHEQLLQPGGQGVREQQGNVIGAAAANFS